MLRTWDLRSGEPGPIIWGVQARALSRFDTDKQWQTPLSVWCCRQNSATYRLEWTLLYTVGSMDFYHQGAASGASSLPVMPCAVSTEKASKELVHQRGAPGASCARLRNGARVLHLVPHCLWCLWCIWEEHLAPFALPLWCL